MKTNSTKEKIFFHAALLFREKGYTAASIRGIADHVGIEPSSIYSHIRSKEDILVKICMDAAGYFTNGMSHIKNSSKSTWEKINLLIDLHIQAVVNEPTTITVFTDEWKHLPEDTLQTFLKMRKDYEAGWKEIIETGIKEGFIHPGEPWIILQTILSSMRWINDWYAPDKKDKISRVQLEIKSMILRGLKNL